MIGLKDILFGSNGGITKGELHSMVFRNRFSDYLPYTAYDPETRVYLNVDSTIGFLWECVPLVYAGEDTFSTLAGLFGLSLPEGSVLQFILYADPYIEPILARYTSLKDLSDELLARSVKSTADFYRKGTGGVEAFQGIPIRKFRLFVALKMPQDKDMDVLEIRDSVHETLKGANLFPSYVEPEELIRTLARLLNERNFDDIEEMYSDDVAIRKQIILSETRVEAGWSKILLGDKHLKCITPKKMPKEVNPLLMNQVCGDIWGSVSDTNQVHVPFLLAVNVVFQNLKANLHAKCNFVLQQQAAGSFAPSLKRKQEEYLWATGEIERGTKFVRIMPIAWTIADSEDRSREAIARARRLWESKGFVMQEDKGILKILFIASLPFGLYNAGKNLDDLDRDFICHSDAAVKCLPVQGDVSGGSDPQLLFAGRKGQVISFDLFDKRANNNNALVCAQSGSGKSFLVNYIVFNYYAAGAYVRIIDIGGSYRKMAKVLEGRFITFGEDSDIVINPFSNVESINSEISTISSIVAQMIFSATATLPDELDMTLVKNACRYAYEALGGEEGPGIDMVAEYLRTFPVHANTDDFADSERELLELKQKARDLAFNLQEFTTSGVYGRWFNGRSTLDISKDRLVVLELEELKAMPELFKVVTLQVINAVTQDLYLSDRFRQRLIIFDEAWQFFREGSMLKNVIEEGYRRARKYGGSFTTITQSVMDIMQFGDVGNVIFSNSAFKFFLQADDYEKAKGKNLLDYDDFTMRILKSVRSVRPKYSEIFMDTPIGSGVARLTVDPYSYYLYTSDAGENAEMSSMVKSGMTYAEAVDAMVRKYRRGA